MLNLLDFIFGNQDEGVFRRIPLRASGRLYGSPMSFGEYDRGNRILKIYNMTINLTAEQISLIRKYGELLAGQSTYRP